MRGSSIGSTLDRWRPLEPRRSDWARFNVSRLASAISLADVRRGEKLNSGDASEAMEFAARPWTVGDDDVAIFELGGQGQGLVFRVFSQSVSYFTVPPRAHPSCRPPPALSPAPPLPVTNTSTEYSFPGATVLFQISTADKTHTCSFHVCVQCWLVSFLGFRRDTPHPVLFLEGRFTLGRCTLSRLIEFRAPPAAQAARPRPAAPAARGPRPRAGVPSTF